MEGDDETTSVTMIDDEIYSNGGGGEEKRSKPNLSSELLDAEVYASLYSGRTKVTRLMFIADRCDNQVMKLEALRMAYEEIKKGENTNLFKEVVEKIDGKLGSEYCLDQIWVDSVDRKAEVRKEKLENELNAYRTNLIKESIRMGYNDFGDFYYSHGDLGDAFKNYTLTRDYCTTSKHILQMCLNAILISIEMGQFAHVATYVSEAEQTPDALDPVAIAKLRCAAGLYYLEDEKYTLAACKFLETGPELGNNYTEVIAPQDVATYGGLCALASFDRTELKNKVIDNINFRSFIELVPKVREIINDFYSSRYASCLEYLENLKANVLLDIHLHDHFETLYNQILHKACSELPEAVAGASVRVVECKDSVTKYENAKVAYPHLQKLIELDAEIQQLEDKIRSDRRLLKDKKRVFGKERKTVEGEASAASLALQERNAARRELARLSKNGIRGFSFEELERHLRKAQLDYADAVEIRSRLKVEHRVLNKQLETEKKMQHVDLGQC